jgi:hypothetical protein
LTASFISTEIFPFNSVLILWRIKSWAFLRLLEIENNLVGDDRLAAELARALALDLRTRDLPIGIYTQLGEVRLSGAVHTSEQRAVVEEIVRDFPGVRSVINDLVVDSRADLLPVLIPTGIEAEDKVPGKYIRHTK